MWWCIADHDKYRWLFFIGTFLKSTHTHVMSGHILSKSKWHWETSTIPWCLCRVKAFKHNWGRLYCDQCCIKPTYLASDFYNVVITSLFASWVVSHSQGDISKAYYFRPFLSPIIAIWLVLVILFNFVVRKYCYFSSLIYFMTLSILVFVLNYFFMHENWFVWMVNFYLLYTSLS